MNRARSTVLLALAVLLALSCSSSKKPVAKTAGSATSMDLKGVGGERCDATKPGRETSEYDTSGDGKNDVRKVFVALGEDVEARLVMICREADVNGDGRKDVVRLYDDEGRSLREESDRDFDGRMDMATVYQEGKVVQQEIDENRDGKVDTKIFLAGDKFVRTERDLAGRSTPDRWRPDRWEYYEEGRVIRMGTDLDGDSKVDRWDRDSTFKSSTASEVPEDPEAVPASSAAKVGE
jgi:hypothetical protein